MFHPQVILHPTDFSKPSDSAFGLAVDLARQYSSTLLLLHVAESLGPENVTFGEVATQLQPTGYQHRLLAALQNLQPPPGQAVQLEHLLVEGNPADEIVRIAHERGCGLIVMGTHGRTGWNRLLLGSVAEKVVRTAHCPALTIKSNHKS